MTPTGAGYRSYEVYQRARLGDTTELIKPRQLSSADYLSDPAPLVAILREHYPCYRDWPGNAFWVTRYDDVTSVFTDDANFETRSRASICGRHEWGRDFGGEIEVLRCLERTADGHGAMLARRLVDEVAERGGGDLATEVLARFPFELLCVAMGVEPSAQMAQWYLQIQRAQSWQPAARADGLAALDAVAAWAEAQLEQRRSVGDQHRVDRDDDGAGGGDGARDGDGDSPADLLSVIARLGGTGADLAITLLEMDHASLHGLTANLWFHLLTRPDLLTTVGDDPLMARAAVLETWRHSPPVVSVDRHTRHEIERFGRLLPEGALVRLSAVGANRDPRVFERPDEFDVHRRDLCQREPRGQYRADGLPAGVSFGTGPPSQHPAVPEDRPRSRYAITRDLALTITRTVLDASPHIRLVEGASLELRALQLGEIRTCWSLPVTMR
jgi:cytochrome P450